MDERRLVTKEQWKALLEAHKAEYGKSMVYFKDSRVGRSRVKAFLDPTFLNKHGVDYELYGRRKCIFYVEL